MARWRPAALGRVAGRGRAPPAARRAGAAVPGGTWPGTGTLCPGTEWERGGRERVIERGLERGRVFRESLGEREIMN